MQVFVENPNTIVIDVDQGRQGRGIQNITYTEVSGQYFLIVTYTDGTTETLGPLVVTGGAAFLLGGNTGSIPYQSAPNTTVFLPIGTQNQVVVAGATAPQYTSALTGLTVNNSAIGNTAPSTGAFTNLSASGTFALTGDQVQISEGGTGQTTANGAFNALAPSQTGNAGKYLKTDGTNTAWDQLDISTADITGTLPIANGGTGQTTANSALNALLPTQAAQSGKYLKTDGTNASWDQLDISTADITGVLPVANGGTGASTAAGARANLSAAILGTNNDITSMTGVTGGISTPDFVQFDTTATEANAVGKVYWDAAQGTLDLGLLGGNVVSRIGQSLVAYVTNAEAVTITKGQAVYLFSAQGNRASVKLASNLSDATSAKTFGVVAENIPANGTGFIMCQGVLEGLNLGAYTAGDTLYLGATPGSLTATKPYAPNHLVYVGLVERANAGNGQLYVKVQNGYELDEIHDVQIINPQNGQTIIYDASTSLWKNANLTAGSGISVTNGAASITVSNTGVLSFSGGTTGLTPSTSTTGAVTLGGTLNIASGGTGQTTANDSFNALAPSQTGNAGKYLKTDGTNSSWDQLDISTADITGTLPIANGGTGQTTANAALNALLPAQTAQSGKYLKTDGTNSSWDQLDISTGDITGTLPVANGGTGATTAAGALTNLNAASQSTTISAGTGLTGGGDLSTNRTISIANTTVTAGAYGSASDTLTATVNAQGQLTALAATPIAIANTQISGLGTMSTQNASSVSITGGTITGITDLAVADGGTGASDASTARSNLGAAASATTISAGTGLSGGGDLSVNRTLSIANTTVTAGAYGSASNTLTATVNAQGQLTALAATPIAIANTQISGLGTMSTQNSNSVTITGGSITGITDLAIADGGTGASTASGARTNLGLGTSATLNAGVALGVATLDAGGTVPLSQLPASIQGGVSYQGSWDAATNTPTIVSGVGSKGYYYVVSVAGSTNINGITDWLPGDWIIYNGTVWQKIDNTDAVASVNGYTGVVVLNSADVGAPPTSRTITAGTGLTGGGDLSANRTISIANTTVAAGSYGSASSVGTFTVNGQGQLTAAASTPIAITNTQVSGLGTMSTQNANSVAITGGSITGITDLAVADGGTGASDAATARTNLGAAASATTISAGTGLSGGGDLSANRTLSIANTTVTAASYGSASSVGTFTVNAQGQLTAAASTPIAIANTQVSGLGTMSTQNANAVAITGGSVDGTTIGGTTRAAGSFTTLTLTNALDIANGGTGQTTANAAFNALAPSQTGNAGKYLTTDGSNTSWATNPLGTVTSVDVSGGTTGLTTSGGPITSNGTITLGGTLATTNGGTGLTSFTANRVFYASSTSAIGSSANLTFNGTTLNALAITENGSPVVTQADIGTADNEIPLNQYLGSMAYQDGTNYFNTGMTMGFRNRLINGAMQIDQRNAGASVTTSVLQSSTYVLDRWAYYNDVVSKRTIQQVSTAPAGFTNSMLVTVIATDTVGPQQFVIQQIEGLNVSDLGWGTSSAKNCTLSFWVRSSVTGQMGGSIQNSTAARSYPFAYTINTANTWEYKTVNISGDTSGTWLTTNGVGIRLQFENGPGFQASPAGSWVGINSTTSTGSVNLCATNGATWYITGVQFEVGTQATPFDWRPYTTELQLCQRYYQKIGYFLGYLTSSTATRQAVPISVALRATPIVTVAATPNSISNPNGSNGTPSTISNTTYETNATTVWFDMASSATMSSAVVGSGCLTTALGSFSSEL